MVALIDDDQPYLAAESFEHAEEPVALIAHPDKHKLEEARRAVTVEVEPLPPVLTMEDSSRVFKSFRMDKGDVDSVWAAADFVVEGEYSTGAQEQLYIENNGMIAVANPQDGVTVWGSLQCPYYVHKALRGLFDLPDEKVRVVQMETGGGFGGKEEYPSMIAGHAALLAWKSGKPVKIIYDRAEDMVATTKRHPSVTRTSDGGVERRQITRHGDRFFDRWRRLHDAFARGFVARHDSRGGSVLLPERAGAQPRRRDELSAARGVSADSARRRASSRWSGT